MPLKLTVGLARKVGQPDYGSLGASCGLELELPAELLERDPEAFQERVRSAYVACARAVDDELARQGEPAEAEGEPVGGGRAGRGSRRPAARRPATAAQVRALRALASRRGLDLDELVARQLAVEGPEELTLAEASRLIDELQAEPAAARG